jgi:hypothetical protein
VAFWHQRSRKWVDSRLCTASQLHCRSPADCLVFIIQIASCCRRPQASDFWLPDRPSAELGCVPLSPVPAIARRTDFPFRNFALPARSIIIAARAILPVALIALLAGTTVLCALLAGTIGGFVGAAKGIGRLLYYLPGFFMGLPIVWHWLFVKRPAMTRTIFHSRRTCATRGADGVHIGDAFMRRPVLLIRGDAAHCKARGQNRAAACARPAPALRPRRRPSARVRFVSALPRRGRDPTVPQLAAPQLAAPPHHGAPTRRPEATSSVTPTGEANHTGDHICRCRSCLRERAEEHLCRRFAHARNSKPSCGETRMSGNHRALHSQTPLAQRSQDRRSAPPHDGTASAIPRATTRRWRACCRGSWAVPPAAMAAFDESCRCCGTAWTPS